jgi:sugar O-acyltransferase (sialic acid O-acetyltransferase NeuD family)
MSRILIIGAGGHGKVVADILQRQGEQIIGFLDDVSALWGSLCMGLPILGSVAGFQSYRPEGMIVGVGSNAARKKIVERLGDAAQNLWINAIHPQAVLAESVRLGRGVVICAGVVVNPDVIIGNHAIINTAASLDHDDVIADYVHVAPGCHLAGQVQVDEGTLLGVGVSVISGCKIGRWATVGAGAVVVGDIPERVTAKGVPARWSTG